MVIQNLVLLSTIALYFRLGSGAGPPVPPPQWLTQRQQPSADARAFLAPIIVPIDEEHDHSRKLSGQEPTKATEPGNELVSMLGNKLEIPNNLRPMAKPVMLGNERPESDTMLGNKRADRQSDTMLGNKRVDREPLEYTTVPRSFQRRFKYLHHFMWGFASLGLVTLMFSGPNHGGTTVRGPPWDPSGTVTFRNWMREIGAWLNVTSSRLSPTQQAAAIQLGLLGTAREFAMTLPPSAISFGAAINGTHTDPVTYLLYTLGNRFEALEDERTLTSGNAILDFTRRPGERIDLLLSRFDMARHEARSVGAEMTNYHNLTTILIRAVGVSGPQLLDLLRPTNGRMPTTQLEYDNLVNQLRNMGHILERSPGNVMHALFPHGGAGAAAYPVTTEDQPDTNTVLMTTTPGDAWNQNSAFGGWHQGNVLSGVHGNMQPASIFPTQYNEEDHYDSGTDSDTSSSCGGQDDYDDLQGMTEQEQGQELFWLQKFHEAR